MGTYYIPRNLKGNSRILYIFTIKSLLYTGVGAAIGLIFYFIFAVILRLQNVGVVAIAIFAAIGFAIGSVKIPRLSGIASTKNVAGDSLDEVIKRYMLFRNNRKVYSYAVTRDDKVTEKNGVLQKFADLTKEEK